MTDFHSDAQAGEPVSLLAGEPDPIDRLAAEGVHLVANQVAIAVENALAYQG
jgi:hypothetical protein